MNTKIQPNRDVTSQDEDKIKSENSILMALQDKRLLVDSNVVKNDVKTALSTLAGSLETVDDIGTLKEVQAYITSAINYIKAHQVTPHPFLCNKREPSTKHVKQQ